jgi:argininosuccinate synthase
MSKEKVVLAYSGGLDTSVCVKWLQDEKNLDVVCVCGNVGQEETGLDAKKQKALDLGVLDCQVLDLRDEFSDEFLTKAIAANSMYENKYPLLSALSRPLLAKKLVEVAHEFGATYVAHGCTGKGNDQVRFEAAVKALDPELKVIAPVREWDLKCRPDEVAYAHAHNVPVPEGANDNPYSIDDNLWGRAIECGVLEDPMNRPPLDIYTMTTDPEKAPEEATEIEVEFKAGLPVAIDGEQMSYLDIIAKMNQIAGANGFGRIDMIENRMIGVKSRECYEAPGALALIVAHRGLEDMCLEREVLRYKLHLEHDWATMVYNGQWFSPLKHAVDAFMATTQQCVTGTVRLKFYKGNCTVTGRKSDFSLYDYGLATYDAADTFNHKAAKGFIDLYGLSTKVWAKNRREQGVTDGE